MPKNILTASKTETSRRFLTGFTLVEIVIVIALTAIVLGFTLFIGIDFYRSYILSGEHDNFVTILRKARSNALENIGQSSHGVYISTGTKELILFKGNSYASRDAAFDEPFSIAPLVTVDGITEIVFSRLSGESSASGTIMLSTLTASSSISINSEGRIN